MISIIICSRSLDITFDLKINIQLTIGIEYELIVIDNSTNKYSIFSAYNEGVRRAKYPYLCFMHDDILFHTTNWGRKIIEHLSDINVGIIGVAGGHCILNTPSSWWSSHITAENVIQSFAGCTEPKHVLKKNTHLQSTEVVAVDGLWFCGCKELFDQIEFDEKTYDSFHFYDIDISMQARKSRCQVRVVYDILIEHKSDGKINVEWFRAANQFNNKWKNVLPQTAGINIKEIDIFEVLNNSAQMEFHLFEDIYVLNKELSRLRKSKAYKLGKQLLKPFSFITNR